MRSAGGKLCKKVKLVEVKSFKGLNLILSKYYFNTVYQWIKGINLIDTIRHIDENLHVYQKVKLVEVIQKKALPMRQS